MLRGDRMNSREKIPRRERRFPTYSDVEIMSESGEFRAACILRDISRFGGFLRIPSSLELPERIAVWIPKLDKVIAATIVWRNLGEIGVRFDEEIELSDFVDKRQSRAEIVASYFAPQNKTNSSPI